MRKRISVARLVIGQVILVAAAAGAAPAPSAAIEAPAACDGDTLSERAYGECQARLERSARRAFLAARAECRAPGHKLTTMVARVFDPEDFGRGVIEGWRQLTEEQQHALAVLADRVVGGEERQRAIAAICMKDARLTAVRALGETVHIKLRRPHDDECTSLMFRPAGVDGWRYLGVWFCGVSPFMYDWRHKLGGGDSGGASYDTAMRYLRDRAAASPP